MARQRFLAAGEVARALGVPAHRIQDLFDARKLDDDDFPRVSGRRLFTARDLERIAGLLGVPVPSESEQAAPSEAGK